MARVSCSATYGMVEFLLEDLKLVRQQNIHIFFFNDETSDVSQLNILPGSLFRVAQLKLSKFVSMR